MAARGRRAKQRQAKHMMFGVTGILAVIAVVVALGYFVFTRDAGPDKVTLCPSAGPRGHYVVLVDKTDPLTFTQKQAFSVFLDELVRKRVPEGYLLSVFVLGENFENTAQPLVELCNPGFGLGKSEMTNNLEWARRTYQEKFVKPALGQAEALQSAKAAKSSPVLEMLQIVAINAFRKHDVQGERRLILMSDMLHNSGGLSMYQGVPDYSTFAATPYGRKTAADLNGVKAELFYLVNNPKLQNRRLITFWENYFEKSGARLVEARPLEG